MFGQLRYKDFTKPRQASFTYLLHIRSTPSSGSWLCWRGGLKIQACRDPPFWPLSKVSGCIQAQCPQSLRKKQGSLMNRERNELLVGRFPIFPREKQIQFLFIRLPVQASIHSGFLGSMANLSPLLSASLVWSLLELAAAVDAEDHPPSAQLAPNLLARENWDFVALVLLSCFHFRACPPGRAHLHCTHHSTPIDSPQI